MGILLPCGILLVTFLLWRALLIHERIQTVQNIDTVAVSLRDRIGESVEADVRALARMAARWEVSGKPPRAYWEADAARYIHDSPSYQAVEWIDPSLHIRWVVPLRGNEAALKINLIAEKRRAAALLTARDTKKIMLSRPIHLVQGGAGFLVYVPIFRQNRFEGFITGVFRIDRLLASLPREMTRGYALAVVEGGQEIYRRQAGGTPPNVSWQRSAVVTLRDVSWKLQITPDAPTLNAFRSPLPAFVLLTGLLTAALVSGLLYYAHLARMAHLFIAEEAARRVASETRVRTILESITDAFLTFDREWRFVSINQEAEQIMGRPRAELIGKNVWEEYPEAVKTEWYREYHRAVRDNVAVAFEVFNVRTQRWSDVRAYPSAEGLSVYFRDVTERKQAEEKIRISEENLNHAQMLAHIGSWELDLQTMQGRWSDEMFHIYGLPHAAAPPPFTQSLLCLHPADRQKVADHAAAAVGGEINFRILLSDGTLRYVHALSEIVPDANGKPVSLRGTVMDITERTVAEAALHESEARFRLAIQSIHEGLTLQNQSGEILIHNRRAGEILGLSDAQLEGRTSLDPRWRAIHEDGTPWPGDTHPAMITLREGGEQRGAIMGVHKPNGELAWVSINSIPMFHEGEAVPYAAVVTFSDITAQKQYEEQLAAQVLQTNEANVQLQIQQDELAQANTRLEALATTDGLTGLKNHRAFQEKLTEEYERALRYQTPLSLLLLDVDHFKKFNDQFGHPAGDQVLRQVAAALQGASRSTDFVARYGGEEFVILLPGTDERGALECGERVRAAVAAQCWEQREITVSVGAGTLQALTANGAALVGETDQALYRSKAAGRNCVTHFSEEAILVSR